jgi:hypothetical protein
MSYNLFLDDVRSPHQVKWITLPHNALWTIVRSYDEFVKTIEEKGVPAFVTFDHDLSIEHYALSEPREGVDSPTVIPYESYSVKTGYDCAKWLVEYCRKNSVQIPNYAIHSMNPIGRGNIDDYLKSFKNNNHHLS